MSSRKSYRTRVRQSFLLRKLAQSICEGRCRLFQLALSAPLPPQLKPAQPLSTVARLARRPLALPKRAPGIAARAAIQSPPCPAAGVKPNEATARQAAAAETLGVAFVSLGAVGELWNNRLHSPEGCGEYESIFTNMLTYHPIHPPP